MQEKQNDFTKNSMAYNIMSLAIPMTIAQLINVLYSLVDRMYIRAFGTKFYFSFDRIRNYFSYYYVSYSSY